MSYVIQEFLDYMNKPKFDVEPNKIDPVTYMDEKLGFPLISDLQRPREGRNIDEMGFKLWDTTLIKSNVFK